MVTVEQVIEQVADEAHRATALFAPFNSPHEGLAVIWEEFEELKEHVWHDTGRTPAAMREAIQIAAMAVRYIHDLHKMSA